MTFYSIYKLDRNRNKTPICGSMSKESAEKILRENHPKYRNKIIVWYEPEGLSNSEMIPPVVEGRLMVGVTK